MFLMRPSYKGSNKSVWEEFTGMKYSLKLKATVPEFGQVCLMTLPRETRKKGIFSESKHKGKPLQQRGTYGKFLAPCKLRPDKFYLMSKRGKVFPSTENIVSFPGEFSLAYAMGMAKNGNALQGETITSKKEIRFESDSAKTVTTIAERSSAESKVPAEGKVLAEGNPAEIQVLAEGNPAEGNELSNLTRDEKFAEESMNPRRKSSRHRKGVARSRYDPSPQDPTTVQVNACEEPLGGANITFEQEFPKASVCASWRRTRSALVGSLPVLIFWTSPTTKQSSTRHMEKVSRKQPALKLSNYSPLSKHSSLFPANEFHAAQH